MARVIFLFSIFVVAVVVVLADFVFTYSISTLEGMLYFIYIERNNKKIKLLKKSKLQL